MLIKLYDHFGGWSLWCRWIVSLYTERFLTTRINQILETPLSINSWGRQIVRKQTFKNETRSLYLSFIFYFAPSCPFGYHGDSPSHVHPVPEQLSAVQTGLKDAWSVQIPISLSFSLSHSLHLSHTSYIYSIQYMLVYLFPLMCSCMCVCFLSMAVSGWVCVHESKVSCLAFLTLKECWSACVCVCMWSLVFFIHFKCL